MSSKKSMLPSLLASTLLIVVSPLAANAAAVTYDFTGTVTFAIGNYGSVALGSTVTGTYTFNLSNALPGESQGTIGSTTGSWTAANNGGTYYGPTPSSAYVFSSTASFSGFTYSTAAPGAYQDSTYVSGDSNPGATPANTYEASEKEAPSPGTSASSLFTLEGSSTEWGSDGLPLAISGANPNNFGFIVIGTPSGYATQLGYEITSLTPSPVPIPAAAWLMLSGLGGLGVWVRKRS